MTQTNLTKKQKLAWIEALKSGNYNQCTKGYMTLRNGVNEIEYCCLAVLNCVTQEQDVNSYAGVQRMLDDKNTSLVSKLYTMNDCSPGGKTFVEIADWISENIAPIEEKK